MSELIYPTLDLFLYDLREGLGDNDTDIITNQKYFLRKLPEQVHPRIKQRDDIEGEYIELLGKRGREHFDNSTQKYTLKGWYYPVRLGDCYGLLLDSSVEHSFGNVQQAKNEAITVSCFTELKAEIETRLNETSSTVGQVWMLSGQLSNFSHNDAEFIAKECCKVNEINLNWDSDFRGQSSFLGGMLFELWHYRLNILANLPDRLNIHHIQDNHYVIIAIYPDRKTAREASKFNFDWLRLFAYRSKIIWAYGQSQYLKKKLQNYNVVIDEYQKAFKAEKSGKLDLNKLRHTLINAQNTLWDYSVNLNYLSTLRRTIEINLLNYERRLGRIKQKLNDLQSPSDLKFLHDFIEDVERRYLGQTKNDHESLNIGLTLLTDLINAIRGITEIERSQRDRTFQNTIAILGVFLATSSFIASITGQFPEAKNAEQAATYPVVGSIISHWIPEPWLAPVLSVTISIGIGIVFALITWLIIKIWELIRK
ncbi:hypothetical protein [Mastigocoleus testarum]|uniref:Uncharacterized protein n=1 Tax=Mastigocoleus testarum BC008 TaxID=371196 RepID=A0A0V7ZT16_9CYAN|nr:hypothetical protein [Mastigocoleus testarum]KST64483.1 hypothetical protein BC008_17800 [Mastigocoleus testarum BC008]KST67812.1 hypothetical protein BC008_44520 [Mastigocoleus testarum BC008]